MDCGSRSRSRSRGYRGGQPLMVTGTGDPKIDVPAVQAAVDQGGSAVLAGHFSFDTAPATPAGAAYARMVTVSKGVVISGAPGDQGDMPTIEGGSWPFFIDAFGSRVAIRGLRFVGPKAGAIWVYAARGLTVANCRQAGHAECLFVREGPSAARDLMRSAGAHARRIGVTTWPAISVSRKWRPLNLKVNFVWSIPRHLSMVAWRSWMCTGFSTML